VRSARARFTHSRSAVPVRSKARAAARTLLPSSRTRRTACSKSSVNWPAPAAPRAFSHRGHRNRLSEDVHEIGSSAGVDTGVDQAGVDQA
jgi:hypothetical protein